MSSPARSALSDRELVLAFQRGEEGAYAELYRRHHIRVRKICARMLHRPHDAEEATQETFLRGYRALPTFNGRYQVGAWLARIAMNICFDELRARGRGIEEVPEGESIRERAAEGDPPETLVGERLGLERTFEEITPLHARALVLRAVEGLSHKEMAGELDMSPPQVKALLHRARSSFKRAWKDVSGWALAPFGFLGRADEGGHAGGSIAGVASPALGLTIERVAASAVAAVLALSGVPSEPSNEQDTQTLLPDKRLGRSAVDEGKARVAMHVAGHSHGGAAREGAPTLPIDDIEVVTLPAIDGVVPEPPGGPKRPKEREPGFRPPSPSSTRDVMQRARRTVKKVSSLIGD